MRPPAADQAGSSGQRGRGGGRRDRSAGSAALTGSLACAVGAVVVVETVRDRLLRGELAACDGQMGLTLRGVETTDLRYPDAERRWCKPRGAPAQRAGAPGGGAPAERDVWVDEESGVELEHLPADTVYVRGHDVRMVHLPADLDFSGALERMRHDRGKGDRERATKRFAALPKGVPTQGVPPG